MDFGTWNQSLHGYWILRDKCTDSLNCFLDNPASFDWGPTPQRMEYPVHRPRNSRSHWYPGDASWEGHVLSWTEFLSSLLRYTLIQHISIEHLLCARTALGPRSLIHSLCLPRTDDLIITTSGCYHFVTTGIPEFSQFNDSLLSIKQLFWSNNKITQIKYNIVPPHTTFTNLYECSRHYAK